ncbi:MAG: hypothetical protein KGZ85_07980 [Ignavibacterium sp.]|nr:hypothetical protein [Ignavibacterium sp.]
MSRIKASKVPQKSNKIKPAALIPNGLLTFSFKYLSINHKKFCIDQCENAYFKELLTRLLHISSFTYNQFISERSTALRAHIIRWDETSEPEGYSHLPAQLRDYAPYQFGINNNNYGRVHGFLHEGTFYIVWIDPDHLLYNSQ